MPGNRFLFIEKLSPLYEDVQSGEIFADSKFFVDCVPAFTAEEILSKYETHKKIPGFDLKTFVKDHFIYPAESDNHYSSANKSLSEHLSGLWDVLTRKPDTASGTLIALPHPYIVPGGRFREIYYWDSYFTMLGLQVSKRIDIIQNMVDNFAYLIDQIGHIPNGNRSYYLSRSQPPFFAFMLTVLMEEKGNTVLTKYLPQLKKEYLFWMDGVTTLTEIQPTTRRVVRLTDGSILNRYWDDADTPRPEAFIEDQHTAKKAGTAPKIIYRHIRAAAESGWDFSSRWFRDGAKMETIQTTRLIPVDLNSLLYFMETLLAKAYEKQDPELSRDMLTKSEQRKEAIQEYCWNDEKDFFFDYQFAYQQQTGIFSLAAAYPLFCGCATRKQAAGVARIIEEQFLFDGGLVTTLTKTGQQWDAPNGWAPLQWIAYKGLKNYGHNKLADKIRTNWLNNNEKIFATTGKMMEKYNVNNTENLAGGGEYPNQDGFGWTNGVYLALSAEGKSS